ncbi:ferredoxin-type protein NapF [Primorskyibacter sp. S187A]|uniref:ferredoxin-type protein NapF n=1 Tax=Primorskyibacter sp. S187A TaxID=3415130 RepID=UPI003C7EB067
MSAFQAISARSRDVQRPPWSNEASIRAECTSCGDCLRACPEAILIPGPARTPSVDFSRGECTFCGACAEACHEGVFAPTDMQPWDLVAQIGPSCLLASHVSCRLCTDFCETDALRFDLRAGGVGALRVEAEACTGCGACVSTCPVAALTLTSDPNPARQTAKEPVA